MWDRQPPQKEPISISFWLSYFAFPNEIARKNDIALEAENFDSFTDFLEILFPFLPPTPWSCLFVLSHLLLFPQPMDEALLWFSEWAFQKCIIILSSYRRPVPEITVSYWRVCPCVVLKSPLQALSEVSPPDQSGPLIQRRGRLGCFAVFNLLGFIPLHLAWWVKCIFWRLSDFENWRLENLEKKFHPRNAQELWVVGQSQPRQALPY